MQVFNYFALKANSIIYRKFLLQLFIDLLISIKLLFFHNYRQIFHLFFVQGFDA